ncbi:peptidoglycan-binding protein LysM [Loigolactobacillus backii]|uniref:Peptidoglycan-binding protein LysM n=1 Tax=Loigolactobacillus backii TaxID=375175 RepID=A0A192H2N7_9LACO|nr:peptidoglycan-binding protein LysM [Loigolactobacillus backii]ANK62211.1 peptidoglycan-binding protein LysM [Loigolactobacillus backii]ANK65227.1 peptidoglycan-binding protein LysM [Loigolactobacillus backii]ANK67785.1 peptidoglycan-binding protein LysM [Loigolactobacillus backii]ANK70774.1 peptidoglycan-binding protein LysM [Loigolactobacillus backii]
MKLTKRTKTLLLTTAGAAGLLVGGVQAANAATVTAKAGDTVSGLAKQYGSTVDAIEKANNINSYTHLIFAGQSYNVPDSASQQAATTQQNTAAQQSTTAQATQQSTTTQAASQQTQNQQVAQVQQQATQAQAQQAAPAQQTQTQQTTSSVSGSDASAKAWIANKESGGSYSAQNGQYVGKYQLSSSYLGGDYSAANQERVANNYVTSRYGSWTGAQAFWQANGWY